MILGFQGILVVAANEEGTKSRKVSS